MRLSTFLELRPEQILLETTQFARTLHCLESADERALEDHFSQILKTIALDLKRPQSRSQAIQKSRGDGPTSTLKTPAHIHGYEGASIGLSSSQLVAEYRVLRSCVLRLWMEDAPSEPSLFDDLMRFNEAVDQAVAESVASCEAEVERWRQIFLAVLGHDLRGPLNAASLTASLIAMEAPAGLCEHTAVLTRSVKRMASMLDSLLELNRANLGSGMVLHRTMVDVEAECRAELGVLSAAHPGNYLCLESEGDLHGYFDASRLREALSNLVTNAIKHGLEGFEPQIRLEGNTTTVIISVENSGAIAEADPAVLFEPLRRGMSAQQKTERTNLGLGLFITRQISRAHGGDVHLVAESGRVQFTIILPKILA